ncbi:MAG: SpoIID/LytB domain-containing protein [Patescibacteria group bacterium]|nr:SpoIID/LytB domain-containing protein [Patescibacteria group bacterium]
MLQNRRFFKSALQSFTRAIGMSVALLFFLSLAQVSQAVTIVQSSTVELKPGETKKLFVSLENKTGYTWYGGVNKTSLYLYGDSTVFKHTGWPKNDLAAPIDQSSVAPGQIASASYYVTAPSAPGTYTEMFLMGDGTTWHKNSVIQITFKVSASTQSTTAPPSNSQTTTPTANPSQPSPASSAGLASTKYYFAEVTYRGGSEWQVDPGAHFTVNVKIKNRGQRTWLREGAGAVAIINNKEKSPFWDGSWYGNRLAALQTESSVSGGQEATFKIQLRAPNVPGSYSETFELYVDGISRISGSAFSLPIRVRMPDEFVLNNNNGNSPDPSSTSGSYDGQVLLEPRGPFNVSGDSIITLNYGVKNIGTAVWNNETIKLKEVVPNLSGNLSTVKHSSWPSSVTALQKSNITEPGHLNILSFNIKAPAKSGNYTVRFALEADGNEVEYFDIPVTVTADGYIESAPTTPTYPTTPTSPNISYPSNLPPEPIIRVGIYATIDDTLMVAGVSTGFSLMQNGNAICTFNHGEEAKVVYDRASGVYKASGPRCQTQSTNYFVAVAPDGISPLEVTDFSRPVSWLPGANDNKFRGKLELRYTPATDKVWLINELPIEWYLKGIAETSELSPIEFHKTLLIAARTYAMYHIERATKHANEYYIVDAKYDQVYRGYGQEARSPTIARAIDETRGIVVSYDGKIAITPYFSRSDGRTRDWSEVWYGQVAWCKGVPVPQDNGKTLWGHGVGMSASGALTMAAREGKSYDYILKYFYTGIDLKPWYK